jgi:hypothetical protein
MRYYIVRERGALGIPTNIIPAESMDYLDLAKWEPLGSFESTTAAHEYLSSQNNKLGWLHTVPEIKS